MASAALLHSYTTHSESASTHPSWWIGYLRSDAWRKHFNHRPTWIDKSARIERIFAKRIPEYVVRVHEHEHEHIRVICDHYAIVTRSRSLRVFMDYKTSKADRWRCTLCCAPNVQLSGCYMGSNAILIHKLLAGFWIYRFAFVELWIEEKKTLASDVPFIGCWWMGWWSLPNIFDTRSPNVSVFK